MDVDAEPSFVTGYVAEVLTESSDMEGRHAVELILPGIVGLSDREDAMALGVSPNDSPLPDESVARLLREGHMIIVVDCDGYDDSVAVQPTVHENLTAILGRNAPSVQAILACDRAIH